MGILYWQPLVLHAALGPAWAVFCQSSHHFVDCGHWELPAPRLLYMSKDDLYRLKHGQFNQFPSSSLHFSELWRKPWNRVDEGVNACFGAKWFSVSEWGDLVHRDQVVC